MSFEITFILERTLAGILAIDGTVHSAEDTVQVSGWNNFTGEPLFGLMNFVNI